MNDIAPRARDTVTTADGVTVSLDRYGSGTRETAIVVCHGFFKSKETSVFQRLSRALADGHDVVCMDFRGHGGSSGRFTFSAREGADLDAVLTWAGARYQRLGLLGFSLGAAVALNAAGRHQHTVRSVIAVSAPSSFERIEFQFWTLRAIRGGLEGLERGAGCRLGNPFLKKERPIEGIQRFGRLPVLFIHGSRDAIVGVHHSRRLFAAAHEPKRLEVIEGGGHAESLFRKNPTAFLALVTGWYDRTLAPASPP